MVAVDLETRRETHLEARLEARLETHLALTKADGMAMYGVVTRTQSTVFGRCYALMHRDPFNAPGDPPFRRILPEWRGYFPLTHCG